MKRIIALLVMALSCSVQAEISVVVNPANANAVSADDLNRLFLGRTGSFADGSKAMPLNLAEGQAGRNEFDSKVLNRSSAQLKAYWSKLVFTGKGTPPKEIATDEEMIKLVLSYVPEYKYICKGVGQWGGRPVMIHFWI